MIARNLSNHRRALLLAFFLFSLLCQGQNAYSMEQDTSDVLWWLSFQPETIGNAMFSADGTKIYVSTAWTELHNYVLDAETGQILDTVPGSIRTIFGVSQDGNYLYYNGISKVDAKTNKVIGSPEYLYKVIQADLAKNGQFFIIVPGASPGLYETPLVKYDAETLKPIKQSNFGMERIVKIHPNTTEFAVCTKQYDYWNYYSIIVSRTETMGVGKEIARFDTEPSDMAYSTDGKWFAVAGDYVIKLYNVEQGYKFVDSITHKQIGTQRASTLKIYIKDNFLIFGYNSDGRTTIFDLIQNKIIKQYYVPIYAWSSIAINKQNQLLISSSERLNLINNWDKVSVNDVSNVPFQVSYQNMQLVISYPNEINPKSISITDIKGRIIFQNSEFNEIKGNTVIDLSLQSGVYFVTLTTFEGNGLYKKFAVIN